MGRSFWKFQGSAIKAFYPTYCMGNTLIRSYRAAFPSCPVSLKLFGSSIWVWEHFNCMSSVIFGGLQQSKKNPYKFKFWSVLSIDVLHLILSQLGCFSNQNGWLSVEFRSWLPEDVFCSSCSMNLPRLAVWKCLGAISSCNFSPCILNDFIITTFFFDFLNMGRSPKEQFT